jgi:D-alanine-D-alanine ligase
MDSIATLKQKKILVLSGGWSAERDISLKSGIAVSKALQENDILHTHVDLISEEDANNISEEYDIAFIALHGRGGEDGFIQDVLQSKGIKFTGSDALSCQISLNKTEAKKMWRELLLPTPDFVEIVNAGNSKMKLTPHLSGEGDITALDKTFVVKPANEGSSFGITIVRPGQGSLEEAMREAVKYDSSILVEAFVEGRELTVAILGDEIFHPIHIQPAGEFYDFNSKYASSGTEYIKADLSVQKLQEIKDYAWHAFSSLGCSHWGRVDFIEDKEGNFQIIEVNTIPGLTETSLLPKAASYAGLSFSDIVIKVLLLSCK